MELYFFFFFFNYLFICLFIYFWLCWVFVSVRWLSLVVASGGHSSSWCAGLSLSWPLLLRSTGSRRAGSVIVAHGPSCSAACGIFPDQGLNACPLHWQADSQPLRHQGSQELYFWFHYFDWKKTRVLLIKKETHTISSGTSSGSRWILSEFINAMKSYFYFLFGLYMPK